MTAQESRIRALEEENERLRQLLGEVAGLPSIWRLLTIMAFFKNGKYRVAKAEATIIDLLLRRSILSKESAMGAMYGPPENWKQAKIMDVWICRIRGAFRPKGLKIITVHGTGWRLDEASRKVLREVVKGAENGAN